MDLSPSPFVQTGALNIGVAAWNAPETLGKKGCVVGYLLVSSPACGGGCLEPWLVMENMEGPTEVWTDGSAAVAENDMCTSCSTLDVVYNIGLAKKFNQPLS